MLDNRCIRKQNTREQIAAGETKLIIMPKTVSRHKAGTFKPDDTRPE